MAKKAVSRAPADRMRTVENILDLAPSGHTGRATIGRVGPDGADVHHVPALTPSIRSTVHALAGKQEKHRGHWVIGRDQNEAAKAYGQLGGDPNAIASPEFGATQHPHEASFMSHMADSHGYDNPAHMAQDLSTPPVGGMGPQGLAKGGRSKRKRHA